MSQRGRGREKVGGNVGGRETGATTPITHSIWGGKKKKNKCKKNSMIPSSFLRGAWRLELAAASTTTTLAFFFACLGFVLLFF